MFFDDLPETFPDDAVARALQIAQGVEDDGTVHAVGTRLVEVGKRTHAEGDLAGALVIMDGLVCQLHLADVPPAHWAGIPLGPMMEMNGSAFPPYVPGFPGSGDAYLEQRAAATSRPDLTARYYDFLWCRRGTYLDAQRAVTAYLESASGSDHTNAVAHSTAARYLARAAELALAVNFDRPHVAEVLMAELETAVPEEGGGFAWQVANAVAPIAGERRTDAARVIHALFAEAGKPDSSFHHRKTLLEATEALAVAIRDRDGTDRARREFAVACEAEAIARAGEGGIIEVALLRDAIEAFERIGDGVAIQRLKDRMGAAATRAETELHAVGAEVTIPTDLLEKSRDQFLERIGSDSSGVLFAPLALGIWPPWSRVKQKFEQARKDHPIQWLASRFTLGTEGRVSAPPDDEPERERAYLLDFFSQDFQINASLSAHLVDMVRTEGSWKAGDLIEAIVGADATLGRASEAGVYAYESGDYWTAVHLLVPQMERGFRTIALMLSGNVRRLVRDQGIQVATLGPVLADEAMRRFLGEDIAATFEATFTEPRGLNIRNNTAHGLLDPADDQKLAAFVTLMAVLTAAFCIRRLGESQNAETSDEAGAG